MKLNDWYNGLDTLRKDEILKDKTERKSNLDLYHAIKDDHYETDNRKIPMIIKNRLSDISISETDPVLSDIEWEYLELSMYRNRFLLDVWGCIDLYNKKKISIWIKDEILPGNITPYLVWVNLDNTYEMELTGWIDITDRITKGMIWAINKRLFLNETDSLYYLPWPCNYLYKTVTGKYRIY